MRRIFTFSLILCLLLAAGCTKSFENNESVAVTSSDVQSKAPDSESKEESTTVSETVSENTESGSEQSEIGDESAVSEMVTVYLIKSLTAQGTSTVVYNYDEDYNIESASTEDTEGEDSLYTYFEDKDENGMPRKIRTEDPNEPYLILTYNEYVRVESVKTEAPGADETSETKYIYDEDGNLTERRQTAGEISSSVFYEYEEGVLVSAHGTDFMGEAYEYVVQDGRITAQISGPITLNFEYDENGNLCSMGLEMLGEEANVLEITYEAVEIDALRAPYILGQQKYLTDMVIGM